MFDTSIYGARRDALMAALPGVLILIPGNDDSPIEYRANAYPFRQDGSFRYFFGIDRPGWTGLIDADSGETWLFADDAGIDDIIWLGPLPTIGEQAAAAGIERTGSRPDLERMVRMALSAGRRVHYPPPYRGETILFLSELLARPVGEVRGGASIDLIAAIIRLRELKGPEEIAEITAALAVTRAMHHRAMTAMRPGLREHDIVGQIEGIARSANLRQAYQPVFTARGEVLHNLRYDNVLQSGDLVVHDSGAVSAEGYASDITRTLPVSGRFSPVQRRLYDTVLDAQQTAIAMCRPGVRYLDVHLAASRVLVESLTDLGLFRGDPAKVVESGAYALCFQCGLGHQIGLDVHDMEALGEDHVGYDGETRRRQEFGLRSLRLAKPLKAGMTITVEPGLYFIPAQIDRWRIEGRHADLIDYDRFDTFRHFGGIRIEDDVHITGIGAVILGDPIARNGDEVESMVNRVTSRA